MNMKMFVTAILLFHYAFSTYDGLSKKQQELVLRKRDQFLEENTETYSDRLSTLGEASDEEDDEFEEEKELNSTNGLTVSDMMDEWIKKTVELNDAKLMHENMEQLTQKLVELKEKEEEIEEMKQEITRNMEENPELMENYMNMDKLISECKLLEEKMQSTIDNGIESRNYTYIHDPEQPEEEVVNTNIVFNN